MDCAPSCPGCVALRAKKAALEQEYEMLKFENDMLTGSLEESDHETDLLAEAEK